jgi:hypothetical protein
MHGKLSRYSEFLKKICFNRYLVWSNYFKNQIIKTSKNKNSIIDVIGRYEFRKNKYFFKKVNNNILFLDEDFLLPSDFKQNFKLIEKPQSYNFFFKTKITRNLPESLKNYLVMNNITIIYNLNFVQTIKKYKISKVIAYSSTGLLDACFYGLIPIKLSTKIKKDDKIFKAFVKDGLVLNVKTKKNFNHILRKKYFNIKKIKNILWQNTSYKYKKVKKILKDYY